MWAMKWLLSQMTYKVKENETVVKAQQKQEAKRQYWAEPTFSPTSGHRHTYTTRGEKYLTAYNEGSKRIMALMIEVNSCIKSKLKMEYF